jgi:hypothetical protein
VASHKCALTECGVVEIEVTGGPLTGKKQNPKTGAWYYHIGGQGDENEDVDITRQFVRWAMEPKASWQRGDRPNMEPKKTEEYGGMTL